MTSYAIFGYALDQHASYPVEVLGVTVLVISIAITLAWVLHLYR